MSDAEPTIRYTMSAGKPVVEIRGDWTVLNLRGVRKKAGRALDAAGAGRAARKVDASGVGRLDTAGALEILLLAGGGPDTEVTTREKRHADLFEVVQKNMGEAMPERHVNWFAHWLDEVGHSTVELYRQAISLCAFFGEILVVFVEACLQPRRFRINVVVRQMYEVWVRALAIVGVLCFLIGVVIAYQGIQQLRQFGAETFAVEAVGISIFRELGVLPRIVALVISLPLLAFWGNIAGLLGGAVACTIYLDFTFAQFFDRLRDTVGIWHFYTGMIKAPVFGLVIATVGCFEGLQVRGSAESVGQLTTKSVVESIFCVIVLDAIFSIIFLLANV
ncbi:MAG: ABC transporter permease [Alphaproteobacteria bacterium]|nr:ABC transporter permease [Alphaproteobacteria bacterium]